MPFSATSFFLERVNLWADFYPDDILLFDSIIYLLYNVELNRYKSWILLNILKMIKSISYISYYYAEYYYILRTWRMKENGADLRN